MFSFSRSKREPSYVDTGDYEAQTVNEVVKNEVNNYIECVREGERIKM